MTTVLRNISRLLTCPPDGDHDDLGVVESAALAWSEGHIVWCGPEAELPRDLAEKPAVDCAGQMALPGLVECHTHLAFAGSRADEFERRILGHSYLEIAKSGGGIRKTVRLTREASDEHLFAQAQGILEKLAASGVTTLECKSGYGLSLEEEVRLLQLYRKLADVTPIRLIPTFLGAHVTPPEFDGRTDHYVDVIINEMLPQVAEENLARFCDVFVEDGAFSSDHARKILRSARELGLQGKLHVDQITDGGGGELAAELGVTSADHLEHISNAGIDALAESRVVAVSLPLAGWFLKQPALRARDLIAAGVPLAVSTDFNPGSAPSHDLPLAMMVAVVHQGLTAAQAIRGITCNAARALGMHEEIGSLKVGMAADLTLVDAPDEQHWVYHFGQHHVTDTYRAGTRLSSR